MDVSLVGGDLYAMLAHFLLWSLLLLLIESGLFNFLSSLPLLLPKNRPPPNSDIDLLLDSDVLSEHLRVSSDPTLPLRVTSFRHLYTSLFGPPVLAVERASFGLSYGDCFALLGVNGAGKTTTFKALTSSTTSPGSVSLLGLDLSRHFNELRRLIGYCPQTDEALVELLTVEEHLLYYARIKGIPEGMRKRMVERQIRGLNLGNHKEKTA